MFFPRFNFLNSEETHKTCGTLQPSLDISEQIEMIIEISCSMYETASICKLEKNIFMHMYMHKRYPFDVKN